MVRLLGVGGERSYGRWPARSVREVRPQSPPVRSWSFRLREGLDPVGSSPGNGQVLIAEAVGSTWSHSSSPDIRAHRKPHCVSFVRLGAGWRVPPSGPPPLLAVELSASADSLLKSCGGFRLEKRQCSVTRCRQRRYFCRPPFGEIRQKYRIPPYSARVQPRSSSGCWTTNVAGLHDAPRYAPCIRGTDHELDREVGGGGLLDFHLLVRVFCGRHVVGISRQHCLCCGVGPHG